MKVLYIAPRQGYTEELLLIGLVEVLGADVVDFPRMDHLWDAPQPGGPGQLYTALSGLLHEHPEPNRDDLTRRVEGGEFDVMVVSNRSWMFPPSAWFRHVPCVLVDGEDDPERICQTEVKALEPRLYFKRDTYMESDFLRALPFAYPEALCHPPGGDRFRRCVGIFGVEHWPRQFVVARMQHEFPDVRMLQPGAWLTNADYRERLRQAYIGLDVRGFGWTTLRRWEIVGSGAVLLGQKLPVVIPHDFEHRRECWKFDDVRQAVEFARHLSPDEYAEMSARSWEKFRHYHTTRARAEQFLNAVERA